jgi:hypothetical protein
MTKKLTTIRELVNSWTRQSGNNLDLHGQLDLLDLMNDELYSQYQPFAVKPDYMDSLFAWINGAASVRDKKLMFELAAWLLFVGEAEMKTLYQASFTGIITRWVIDQERVDIAANDAGIRIKDAMTKTFFGSIAGMDMGTFCRTNGIQRQSFRPDFREHSYIGSPDSLRQYLQQLDCKRIIAVEDIVGTGQQMKEACTYLGRLSEFPTLLCPMLIAPDGVITGRRLATLYDNLTFEPLMTLPAEATVPEAAPRGSHEPPFIQKLRTLLERLWEQVRGGNPTQQLYGPFGLGGSGSLLLTYLNCPDNVPPIIHHKSDSWEPLFRRASREG